MRKLLVESFAILLCIVSGASQVAAKHASDLTAPSYAAALPEVGSTATSAAEPQAPPMAPASRPSCSSGECLPITELIIVLDCSQSMAYCTPETQGVSKFSIAQWTVYDLLDSVPEGFPVALLFVRPDSPGGRGLEPMTWSDKTQLRRTMMRLRPAGHGQLADSLTSASIMVSKKPSSTASIVVITDGENCRTAQANNAAKALQVSYGMNVQVVGVAPTPAAAVQLEALAGLGGGSIYSVRATGDIGQAIEPVTSRLQEFRNVMVAQCEHARVGLKHCQREKQHLHHELDAMRDQRDEAIDQRNKLQVCLAEKETELKCCREEKEDLEEEVACLVKDLKCCQEKERCTEQQLATTQSELKCCRDEDTKLKDQVACLQKDLTASQESGKKCDAKCDGLTTDLKNAVAARDRFHRERDVAVAGLKCCETEACDLKKQNASLVKELTCCTDKFCHIESELAATKRLLHDSNHQNMALAAKVDIGHHETLQQIAQQQAIASAQVLAAGKPNCCPPGGPNPVFGPVVTTTSPSSVPVASTPQGGTPVGGNPIGGNPVGAAPVGAAPVGGNPVGAAPVGGDPVGGAAPVGGNPVAPSPLGIPGLPGMGGGQSSSGSSDGGLGTILGGVLGAIGGGIF